MEIPSMDGFFGVTPLLLRHCGAGTGPEYATQDPTWAFWLQPQGSRFVLRRNPKEVEATAGSSGKIKCKSLIFPIETFVSDGDYDILLTQLGDVKSGTLTNLHQHDDFININKSEE